MWTSTLHSVVLVASVLAATNALAVPRTMRVDYYHTGNVKQEMFSLDRVVVEPLEWPGPTDKSIDPTNLGKYLFEVRDASGRVLYSRGFAWSTGNGKPPPRPRRSTGRFTSRCASRSLTGR